MNKYPKWLTKELIDLGATGDLEEDYNKIDYFDKVAPYYSEYIRNYLEECDLWSTLFKNKE